MTMIPVTELMLWNAMSNWESSSIRKILLPHEDRIAKLMEIFEALAIVDALDFETPVTAEELGILCEMPLEKVEHLLFSSFQSDYPWVEAEQTVAGSWLWRRKRYNDDDDMPEDGLSYQSKAERKSAAFKVLQRLKLSSYMTREEALQLEDSQALKVGMTALWSSERNAFFEGGILSVLNRPAPVWAGAAGFSACYSACLERSRIAKKLGEQNIDELTRMHCYAAAGMFETNSVLVTTTEQTMALPHLPREEANDFLANLELPMRPYFIDFTGSPGSLGTSQPLPTIPSHIAHEEHVGYMGVLMDQHNWAEGVLLFTPFVLYNVGTAGGGLSTLGMVAVNQTDDPQHIFQWGDAEHMFDPNSRLMSLIPTSVFTDDHPEMLPEYERLMLHGTTLAVNTLYMLNSANVTTVPRTLERREQKRAEKRGWNVADVVYVHRTKRRYEKTGEHIGEREFSHQFDVSAHFRHFTKGPHVWCRVCQSKELPGVVCSACHGTGLDPEKVKPCSRIDESTGELTCPNGCRREFVPHYVKGPEDAPYVPKVRKLVN
jgi:hypothetical protein